MEKKKVVTQISVNEPQGEFSAREELAALLNELLPEERRDNDIDRMALEYIKEQQEATDRLVSALSQDRRLAQVFADVVMGSRKAGPALARYFGKNFFEINEESPEYEEMMRADEEFNSEREEYKKRREAQQESATAWFDALEEYLDRRGLDKDKYLPEIEDRVIIPLLDMEISDEQFARLVKAVDYDKDVEDAFSAGEVKGRNTNINEMRGKMGDGMPKGLSSAATPVEKPKVIKNSLVAKAIGA